MVSNVYTCCYRLRSAAAGVSYDHTAEKGHALTTYTFANSSLKSARTSGTAAFSNTIERIVIAGLRTAPSAVLSHNCDACSGSSSSDASSQTCQEADCSRLLESQWSDAQRTLTIRKPDVDVAGAFHIELHL
jgi:hypothetical protein